MFPVRGKRLNSLISSAESTLSSIRDAGTFKSERIIASAQGPVVRLGNGKEMLNFCSNNYLGLSAHPEIRAAARAAIDSHGFGMSSVRFICGTIDLHKRLEERLSVFHGFPDTILYPSGFDANAGLFEALLGPDDAIVSDALNHASIIDGIRLSKAKRFVYKHMDLGDLRAKLDEASSARIRLVVTDGVFSMDGDIAPLAEIRKLVDEFPNTFLFVDDAHGSGVFGRGSPSLSGARVDILNSTLGKALGGASGGYTCAAGPIVSLLRQKSRPYLYSNSIPPPVVGASLKVLDMLEASDELQARLAENTEYFRSRMGDSGFTVLGDNRCPIVPVLIGDDKASGALAEALQSRGIFVTSFTYPVVPKGGARIRVQISAAHTKQQLSKAVSAFIGAGKETDILGRYTSDAFDILTEKRKQMGRG
jgi:glycine C-acetyltransferase